MEFDLSSQLGPARDQGPRPTCLSFALSDCHRMKRACNDDLSPECIHSISSEQMEHSGDRAISLSSALQALKDSGQTYEHEWPYGGVIKPGLEKPFHTTGSNSFYFDENRIIELLKNMRSIVVALEIGEEFFLADALTCLTDKNRKPIEARHAILIVGSAVNSGERRFRIRNSWGKGWGDNGSIWVHWSYISSGIFIELLGAS